MSEVREITLDGEECIIPTPYHACVTAFYSVQDMERSNICIPFMHLFAAILRLNGLGACETKQEVKEALGEAMLWCFGIHYTHARINGKEQPCVWFKSDAWSHRGPDRSLDEWVTIMSGLREKTAKLATTAARFAMTPERVRLLTGHSTIIPPITSIIHDAASPGEDLRALCDMYKLSPRECFEAAVLKRKDILDVIHKRFFGKKNQKVAA